jgi:hypothetical protein
MSVAIRVVFAAAFEGLETAVPGADGLFVVVTEGVHAARASRQAKYRDSFCMCL